MTKEHVEARKQIVEHGGAQWVGMQEAFSEDMAHAYVLFQAPITHKLMMLPDDEFFTIQAVHATVHAADGRFQIMDEDN